MKCPNCNRDHESLLIKAGCHDDPPYVHLHESGLVVLTCSVCDEEVARFQAPPDTARRLFPPEAFADTQLN